MNAPLDGIRGALLDVDGTLLHGDTVIPGAIAALERMRARGIALRFMTNTTRRSRAEVGEALRRAGIPAGDDEVLTPALLARRILAGSPRRRALLLVPESTQRDLGDAVEAGEPVDWVVVGDLGAEFDWAVLQRAFLALRAGAQLLALHKSPYWNAGERGLLLDAGAFVAALEFGAGVTARLVGKPERDFFDLCLADLGLPAREVVVVGDDRVNDVAGGAAAGCRTVLVRTGKGSSAWSGGSGADPDFVLSSVADLG